MIWSDGDFDSISDLDALLDALLPPEPSNVVTDVDHELAAWGLYSASRTVAPDEVTDMVGRRWKKVASRSGMSAYELIAPQKTTQGCATQVWQWLLNRNVALFGLAALALWVALWWWAL
jgi:hypothetical protein